MGVGRGKSDFLSIVPREIWRTGFGDYGGGFCFGALPLAPAWVSYRWKGPQETKIRILRERARLAIWALREGVDFVYIHVEAPDECGHGGDLEGKIYSIEQIDAKIIGPILEAMEEDGEPFVMVADARSPHASAA